MTELMLKPELRATTRTDLSQLWAMWPEASVELSGKFTSLQNQDEKNYLQIPSWDAERGVQE